MSGFIRKRTDPKNKKPPERNMKFNPDGLFVGQSPKKSECFTWNKAPKTVAFLNLRENRQSDPAAQTRDNAECATESPPEAEELAPSMAQTARTETARG